MCTVFVVHKDVQRRGSPDHGWRFTATVDGLPRRHTMVDACSGMSTVAYSATTVSLGSGVHGYVLHLDVPDGSVRPTTVDGLPRVFHVLRNCGPGWSDVSRGIGSVQARSVCMGFPKTWGSGTVGRVRGWCNVLLWS